MLKIIFLFGLLCVGWLNQAQKRWKHSHCKGKKNTAKRKKIQKKKLSIENNVISTKCSSSLAFYAFSRHENLGEVYDVAIVSVVELHPPAQFDATVIRTAETKRVGINQDLLTTSTCDRRLIYMFTLLLHDNFAKNSDRFGNCLSWGVLVMMQDWIVKLKKIELFACMASQ